VSGIFNDQNVICLREITQFPCNARISDIEEGDSIS